MHQIVITRHSTLPYKDYNETPAWEYQRASIWPDVSLDDDHKSVVDRRQLSNIRWLFASFNTM